MKVKRLTTVVAVFAALASLAVPAGDAQAAGFYLPGRGVRPLGRGGAFVASSGGNLNAMWYNPANLAGLDVPELTVDVGAIDLGFSFARDPRVNEEGETVTYPQVSNQAPPEFSPQILAGGPTGVDGLWWGAGIFAPYLSGMTFPQDGPQRYTLIGNDGSILAFLSAAVAYQPNDNVRIGLGLQNVVSSFRLINVTSGYTGLYGRPEDEDLDILSKIELEDYFSPAANLGAWVRVHPNVEAAISFQTPIEIRDDEAKLTVRMPSNAAFDNARLTNDTVAGSLQLPLVLRGALRFVLDPVDVELAAVWEGWSAFQELQATPNEVEVEGVPGVGSIPVGPLTIPMGYQDTISVRLGGDYRLTDSYTLRAGYTYETGAIPDQYYSVFLADSDKHMVSAGFSWEMEDLTVDMGTAYYFMADRDITDSQVRQINPTDAEQELATIVGNGDYSSRYFVMGLGVNYRFE